MIILARLLSPEDFGLFGMTTLFLGIVGLFSEFGIGSVIVVFKEIDDEHVRQLNTISVMFGVVATFVSLIGAYPIALFFRAPALKYIVAVLGLGFAASGFRTVPYARLQKELRFRLTSLIDITQSFCQLVSVLVLAFLGFGYWALALGSLLATLVGAVLPLFWRSTGFAWPRLDSIQSALSFGWRLLVSRLCWYFNSSADLLVAGRMLGERVLGLYSLAVNIATVPVDKISAILAGVTPTVLSKMQDDPAGMRRHLRLLTEAIGFIVFPVAIGMALVTDDFIAVFLGAKWSEAVGPLRLLCFYSLVRSLSAFLPAFLQIMRDMRFVTWHSITAVAVYFPSFYYASRWGATGIAGTWMVVYPLFAACLYWRVLSRLHMPAIQLFRSLWPPALSTLLMSVAVLVLRERMGAASPVLRLSVSVSVGAMVYIALILALRAGRLRLYLDLIRNRA